MAIHTLHVYDRPKVGNQFHARYFVYAYKHRIINNGWFDTASCQLVVPRAESETILGQYIGARCAFYSNNPAAPIWEGLINRVTVQYGGISITGSMDSVVNRADVTWTRQNSAIQLTGNASNTDSQDKYGIRHKTQKGWNTEELIATPFEDLRDTILNQQAEPSLSLIWKGGNTALVKLECVGFYHTLDWEPRFQSTAGLKTPTELITEDLGTLLNGTTFIDNTDTSQLDTNAGYTTRGPNMRAGTALWQSWLGWVQCGDATNRWIVGVTPTNLQGVRRVYYRQADETVRYTARQADGMRIRNSYGGRISPEYVIPDGSVRVTDILTGYASRSIDPRQFYIMSVDYDAERRQVVLTGADDITSEGVHMYKLFARPYDNRQGKGQELMR